MLEFIMRLASSALVIARLVEHMLNVVCIDNRKKARTDAGLA
jgi:hypothetical protein